MLDYPGNQTVTIFLEDDPEPFLDELNIYYDSNASLSPKITDLGQSSHTVTVEMTLRLRDDVTWHDGYSLTSSDLIFSIEELGRENSLYPLAGSFSFVESIENVDKLVDSADLLRSSRDDPRKPRSFTRFARPSPGPSRSTQVVCLFPKTNREWSLQI